MRLHCQSCTLILYLRQRECDCLKVLLTLTKTFFECLPKKITHISICFNAFATSPVDFNKEIFGMLRTYQS